MSRRWIPSRRWLWIPGVLVALVVLAFVAAFFIDEPLRRSMEREVNNRLQGYTAKIARLDFHPIGFSLDLESVTLHQDAHPDPPVATFPNITASVQWRALLRGALVADFRFDRPKLHVNRQHLLKEAKDDVPIDERGWQHALAAVYPLKINEFRVIDGEVMYIDTDTATAKSLSLGRPITISRLNVSAGNIRNVMSPDDVYPSTVRMDAVLFHSGRFALDGRADFMAVPHAGIDAGVALENVDLAAFSEVARRFDLAIRQGVLSAHGRAEYAPQVKIVRLGEVRLDGFDGDLVHTKASAEKQKEAAKTAGKAAEQISNQPDILVRIDRALVRGGTFGFVNKAAKDDYRVFLSNTNIDITNLSNQKDEGTSTVTLTGKFMGSGATSVNGTFRAERAGPDFDVSAKIENTDLRTMNDALRAHGRFDVVGGVFSLYSELAVKDRMVRGYVKPLFQDVDAYDRTQDRDKKAMRKLYERVVEGVSRVLQNRPRDEVATRADITGPLEHPKANTLQVVMNLIQNAFFKAILPGFERTARGGRVPREARADR